MSEGQCQYANNTIFLTYMSPSCRYVLCCIANVFHSTKETIQKIIRTNLLYSDSAFLITKRWEAGWWRVGGQLATMFYVKQSPVLGWAGLGCCNHSINLSSPLPLPDTNFNQQMSHWTRFFGPFCSARYVTLDDRYTQNTLLSKYFH